MGDETMCCASKTHPLAFFLTGIPIVYILATVPPYLLWDNSFRFLSWCHLLGAVSPWCGSFVYHLFMNLERGETVYYRLLQLDMFGIWMSQSFGKCRISIVVWDFIVVRRFF